MQNGCLCLILTDTFWVPTESYTMANARLRWSVTDWIHLFVEGKNLLDQTYQVELGYPMPGINVLVGFHYKF